MAAERRELMPPLWGCGGSPRRGTGPAYRGCAPGPAGGSPRAFAPFPGRELSPPPQLRLVKPGSILPRACGGPGLFGPRVSVAADALTCLPAFASPELSCFWVVPCSWAFSLS